jgi:hypothetical protein
MSDLAIPGGNGKRKIVRRIDPDQLIGRLRIGDLNKLFAHRYGGSRATYIFPDDDSGLEDLKILAHSYAWSNPLAIPRIIKIRAPWADADGIISEVDAYPKKWRATTLGRLLNFTGKEWRQLRLRTISPVDMSRTERRDFSRILSNGRRRKKRKVQGMKSRAEYLAANSLSRDKPWVAERISRRTWYRRKERGTGLAGIKLTMDRPDLCQQGWDGQIVSSQEGKNGLVYRPPQKPLPPDPCTLIDRPPSPHTLPNKQ